MFCHVNLVNKLFDTFFATTIPTDTFGKTSLAYFCNFRYVSLSSYKGREFSASWSLSCIVPPTHPFNNIVNDAFAGNHACRSDATW